MSLNKFMHPRNKYKDKKPSFLELAIKYPDFRKQITQDDSGKVFLDFKNADALRALTTCLLKEDFDLTVHLPSDRLVPTLPLRLNYLHWLEDIVGQESGKWGVDVGTGASCIYPLLGSTVQGWNFLATEADPENFYHASKNVETNDKQEHIHVKKVSVDDIILEPVESCKLVDKFDFCMCNPPFFADHMEAQAISTTRSVDRAEAHSVSTASPQECIAKGGEVGFIRQMIEESTILKNRIRVYSSMVGKKTSLAQVKEDLRQLKIPKFATTDFCQGKTMRWGIAWSFDESVNFPRSQFEGKKEKKPILYAIPQGSGGVQYNVHSLAGFLKDVLSAIKVHCYQGKTAKSYTSITLTAPEKTWCHQRRQRRQKKRQEQDQASKLNSSNDNCGDMSEDGDCRNDKADGDNRQVSHEAGKSSTKEQDSSLCEGDHEKDKQPSNTQDSNDEHIGKESKRKRSLNDEGVLEDDTLKPAKAMKIQDEVANTETTNTDEKIKVFKTSGAESSSELMIEGKSTSDVLNMSDEAIPSDSFESSPTKNSDVAKETDQSPKEYVLKCVLRLRRAGGVINMELEYLDGTSRELLHQVKTFLINKLGDQERLD